MIYLAATLIVLYFGYMVVDAIVSPILLVKVRMDQDKINRDDH